MAVDQSSPARRNEIGKFWWFRREGWRQEYTEAWPTVAYAQLSKPLSLNNQTNRYRVLSVPSSK